MQNTDVADVEYVCLPVGILVFVNESRNEKADDETDKEGDYLDKNRYYYILGYIVFLTQLHIFFHNSYRNLTLKCVIILYPTVIIRRSIILPIVKYD